MISVRPRKAKALKVIVEKFGYSLGLSEGNVAKELACF